MSIRAPLLFLIMGCLFALVGLAQSWNFALSIFLYSLIAAIMSLGVNMQWGYAGIFNVGIMGFTAVGGVAAVLVSMPPVRESWSVGGVGILLAGLAVIATVTAVVLWRRYTGGFFRTLGTAVIALVGYIAVRLLYGPASQAIEEVNPALSGYLGGLGLPILFAWFVGGVFAAAAAWLVGKVALGLRADYLAIATLGISEILIAIMKNEDWLTRGVKNVTGIPRPVPYEVDLAQTQWVVDMAAKYGQTTNTMSSIIVKLCYAGLFIVVLAILMWLAERALNSPWGRMMRAIRDDRDAAEAMGKDVTARHLQVFILGSAVCGIAGAMLVTLDGQFTPTSYVPLRYTFLIWVMVILGGSGNNWGAVLGGFVIWFIWSVAEDMGPEAMAFVTSWLADDHPVRQHLLDVAPHLRLFLMGLIMLLVLRFAPKGLIPERVRG